MPGSHNITVALGSLCLLTLMIFLFLPARVNSQGLTLQGTRHTKKSFDPRVVGRITRHVETRSLPFSSFWALNSSGVGGNDSGEKAYERVLNYAKKLVQCFTKEGNVLPTLDPISRLVNNAYCRNNSECANCLAKVKACETSNWRPAGCEASARDSSTMEEYPGNFSTAWWEAVSPKLSFHCYSPSSNGTIDAYFRMNFPSEDAMKSLMRELPMLIPRLFVVEKLGPKVQSHVSPTLSWMFDLKGVPVHGNYSVRVTPIAPAALYKTVTLPPMHFAGKDERERTKPVGVSVEYDELTVGSPSTELLVRWRSGLGGNASCYANVFFLDDDADDYFPHERKEPENAFWTAMSKNLNFGKTYQIKIMEKFEDNESQMEVLLVKVRACFEIYNYSFQHCAPPPAEISNVSSHGDGSLVIRWEPPNHSSPSNAIDYYNLTISQTDTFANGRNGAAPLPPLHTLQKHVYSQRVGGNETSVRIAARNTTFHDKITIMLQAYSRGGASGITRAEFEFPTPGDGSSFFEKLWVVGLLGGLGFATVTLFWLRSYRNKLKRKKQLHEYFEKLDKESIQPDPAVVDRYSSKWEIPLGALVIGDVIGEGAFGLVRKAVLYQDGRKTVVAVKSLRDGVDDKESEKFWEEFNILRGLDPHQHVVGLVGIVKSHVPVLVVEYCSGGDLQSHLRRASQSRMNYGRTSRSRSTSTNDSSSVTSTSEGRVRMTMVTNEAYFMNKLEPELNITELDLLCYGRQIASGMEFLSSNKIVHRDLAARNVLIGHNKVLKIADFGLSRDVYEQNWYKKSSNGKIPIKWMALECLLQEVYTTKSDVWSYGILLWEIVTFGGNPYPGIENTRIFDLLKSGYRMSKPENCSDELYQLMLQCWQENPKDRPDFVTIRNKLEAIIERSNILVYMNVDHLRSESDLSEGEEDSDLE